MTERAAALSGKDFTVYRSEWELTCYVRQRVADLAQEYPKRGAASPPAGVARRWRLARHRVGIGLIQLGQALAGADAIPRRPVASTLPALGRPGV